MGPLVSLNHYPDGVQPAGPVMTTSIVLPKCRMTDAWNVALPPWDILGLWIPDDLFISGDGDALKTRNQAKYQDPFS